MPITTGDNNTTNIDQSTHVTICNNYGSESIGHIVQDHDFMRRCFKSMLSEGIPNLLRKIHFDDEYPENQNVRLIGLKRDLMEIFSEDRWKVVPGTQTTEQLIFKGVKLLGDFYDAMLRHEVLARDETQEQDQAYQKTMMTAMSRRGNEYYRLRRNTKAMIIDETKRRS